MQFKSLLLSITIILFTEIKLLTSNNSSPILVHPSSFRVTMNSTVILKCQVKPDREIKVQWIKNSFGIGSTREDLRIFSKTFGDEDKYSLPNDIENGNFDLKISSVNLKDEGIYVCQATKKNVISTSKNATLIVYVHSERPQLVQLMDTKLGVGSSTSEDGISMIRDSNSPITVENGEWMKLRCSAIGGRPQAKLIWMVGDQMITPERSGQFYGSISGTVREEVRKNERNKKLMDSYSIIQAKVNQLSNGKSIQCIARNKGYDKFKLPPSKSIIKILTAPVVTMQLSPRKINQLYTEGSWLKVNCLATGSPDKFVWSWYLNGEKIEDVKTNEYKFQVTRDYHRSILKCVAKNYKEGSANTSIQVKFGPRFKTNLPTIYPSEVGMDVKLSCQADSNPPASIYWQRESSNDILGHDTLLYRKNIQESDFGMYTCTASTDGFTPIFRKVYLAKKTRPMITSNLDQEGVVGKSIKIKCTINAIPVPVSDQISWSFEGRKLFEGDKYSMYQENYFAGTNSILQIKKLASSDFGEYNCSVSTTLGSTWRTMKLSRKIFDISAHLSLLLIVGATLFITLALLIVIIVICVCKRGVWTRKYQKGNPVHKANSTNNTISFSEHPGHFHHMKSMLPPPTLNSAGVAPPPFDTLDYHQQAALASGGLFPWYPLGGGSNRTSTTEQGAMVPQNNNQKSSFVRYGQDVDDRSSIRNGSIAPYRGLDMCSTYTSSIPGSNNGEKQLRSPGELGDDLYNADTLPPSTMMCSMHASPSIPHHHIPNNSHPHVTMVPPPPQFNLASIPQYTTTNGGGIPNSNLTPLHHYHTNITPYQPSISPSNTLLDQSNHLGMVSLDNGQLDTMTTSYSIKSNNSRQNMFSYPLAQSTICNSLATPNQMGPPISSYNNNNNMTNSNIRCQTLERNNRADPVSSFTGNLSNADKSTNI